MCGTESSLLLTTDASQGELRVWCTALAMLTSSCRCERGVMYALLSSAERFCGQCAGVDPDKHLDLQTLGWDKCTAAMEEAISSDKAEPIFKAAADKFQEVAATGRACPHSNVVECIIPARLHV